jgi:hypothetical protein
MNTRQKITCLPMETFSMERVRYFARQLITPEDLTLEQEYFRNKLRRHNRFLHGWGVVCGCMVEPVPDKPWTVKVTPGYVLGPYGDEILIDHEVEVDLHKEGLEGLAVSPCADQLDDWCSQVEVERVAGQPLYVAVKYAECRSRPVRVLVGCGCDETHCEYSRIRDSFAIQVLDKRPESHKTQGSHQPSLDDLILGSVPNCPGCPSEPWVVLAKVAPGENGETLAIDNCDFGENCYRRMVVAFGNFWWHCTELAPLTVTVRISPESSATTPGKSITVDVVVEDATDLGGYEFEMNFDHAVVQIASVEDGGFLESTGRTVCTLEPTIDNDTGSTSFGAVSWGSAAGPVGTGKLAVIKLTATEKGGRTDLQLQNVRIVDTHATEREVIPVGGMVSVKPEK